MLRKTVKLIVCAALVSALALSGCNNGRSSSDSTKESGDYIKPIFNGETVEDTGNNNGGDAVNAADLIGSETEETAEQPYPTMWEVLPEIEETPVSMLEYHKDQDKDGIIVDGYKSREKAVRIPDTIDNLPVVAVYLKDYELTEIITPETTQEISANGETIQYINFPRDSTKITIYTDSYRNFTYYMSPELKCIPRNAFFKYDIDTFVIPENIKKINEGAFSYSKIKEIIIPESVQSIGTYAFECCYELTSVTIPSSVTFIDKNAFIDCTNLKNLTIKNGITTLGQGVFVGCSSLTVSAQ